MLYNSHRLSPRPIPTTASIAIITTKMITANKEIAKAFNHPESKKCFTKASKIINRIIDAIMPENKELNIVLITVPRTTIHTASRNFAFFAPTSALPDNQRTGDNMMIFTTICIKSMSRLSATQIPPFLNPEQLF
jgi:hypothetical protein